VLLVAFQRIGFGSIASEELITIDHDSDHEGGKAQVMVDKSNAINTDGGRDRTRTCDLLRVKPTINA
jgi:hypothetical protein